MTQFNFLECIEQEEYGQADIKEQVTKECVKKVGLGTEIADNISTCHANSTDGSDLGNSLMHAIATKS